MNRRPVVFVGCKDPYHQKGGGPSFVRAHARAATMSGFHPHIFSVGYRNAVEETEYGTFHTVATPLRPLRAMMAPLHDRDLAPPVAEFVAGNGVTLMHAFGPWALAAVRAKRLLRARGQTVTLISTTWTTIAHEIEGKLMNRALTAPARFALFAERRFCRSVIGPREGRGYSGADRLLVNYESVKAMLQREWPALAPEVFPYTAESAFLPLAASPPRMADDGRPVILAVSRADARKGIPVLLEALALLQRRGVRFQAHLIGGGDLLKEQRRQAAALDLSECATLHGRVPDSLPWYRAADIFVLPSLEEGSGSVSLIEALQAGNAVVATAIDGIVEDVRHEESALLVPPGDAAALADALERLAADIALRKRLGAGAAAVYEKRFRPEVLVRALGALYDEATRG